MKKFFFSLVAAMMATSTVFAQGSLLATLSHNGNISAYYGADALNTAMEAAEAGDVITLSSGQFNSAIIDKPVTIRGAGMSVSTEGSNPHEPTQIENNLYINIADEETGNLIMEGLYMKGDVTYNGNIRNAQFQKCRFLSFKSYSDNSILSNATFVHCRISKGFTLGENSSAYFVNSLVGLAKNDFWSSNAEFNNCYVTFNFAKYFYNGSFMNSIIMTNATNVSGYYLDSSLDKSCSAYYCIGLVNSASPQVGNVFSNMPDNNKTNTNFYRMDLSTIFTTNYPWDTEIKDSYEFILNDTAVQQYLGNDGTQVGVYGGNLPYDENVAIPQITKCNVASKSTADGKLSVDIEVKAAEY